AAFDQKLRVEGIGDEADPGIALGLEEALAAGEVGMAQVAEDLDVGRRQRQPHLLAAVGKLDQAAIEDREAAVDHLAPAGDQAEADFGRAVVDLGPADSRRRAQQDDEQGRAGGQAGTAHGHQKSTSVAAPGSTSAPTGSLSTAIAPGGMPR